MRKLLLFMAGAIFGALLMHAPAVDAMVRQLAFGSFNGAAKAIAVDTNGNVKLVIN